MEIHSDPHSSSTGHSLKRLSNANPAMACKEEGVKLFGVRLTENIMTMRKAVSMGNLSCYNSASSSSPSHAPQPSTPEQSESRDPHGYVSDGLIQHSGGLRERKKGVPWTEDEHRMFLVGLQTLGKGDWRGISRNFVPSRTPTQVASHAQKYFLRQNNVNKRKRRSSLFDIISSTTVPTSALEPNPTSSKLSFNLAAPIPTNLETPTITLDSAPLNMKPPGSDLSSISANLCLGRSLESQPKPHQRWPHTFSSQQQADAGTVHASASTSDCMQLLPPLSFMPKQGLSKSEMVRPSATAASPPAMTSSSSLAALCRIDEATDISANLRLSIGPSLLLEPLELSLTLEQPASRHSVTIAGANNNSNAIRVV